MLIIPPKQRETLNLCVHFGPDNDSERAHCFSDEECQRVIGMARAFPAEEGRVEGGGAQQQFRSATVHFIPHIKETVWLYQKALDAAVEANEHHWDFDVTGFFQGLQLIRYEGSREDHYAWHMDIGIGADTGRKISFVVQLSDPADYEGGELEMNSGKILTPPNARGTVVLFPSFMLHRVKPVTSGVRWSIAGWVQSQRHFR